MVAGHQKKARKKRAFAGPTAMEVQDPRLPPHEQSPHRQQPAGGPRMKSSAMEVVLQLLRQILKDTKQLRAGQDSLISEVAELKTSVNQMNQWLDLAESRFSSLEDGACETHQTNSVMSASQSDPMGVPVASSSSFSSHQTRAFSEQFRTASSNLVYSETEEKAHQMLADAWSQERTSENEAALIEAEESGQQEDTFSGESLLIAPEYKTEPQLLTSTEEKAIHLFDASLTQEKIFESQSAATEAEESDEQEDTFCGTSPQEYKPEQLMNTLPETLQPPSPSEMQKVAPLTATQLSRRRPSDKRSGSSASTSTGPSAGALGHLESSPTAEVTSPTKCPRASIVWRYFRKHPTSKFIATCNICRVNVKTGKIGGCGRVGTSALLRHLKYIHRIAQEKKAPSVLPANISKIHNTGRPSVVEKPRRIGSAASAGTVPSAATLGSLASTLPTEVTSPTKCPRASIVWRYFRKHPTSKFIATCNICGVNVKTGKIGDCGKVGTAPLLSHIKRVHHIVVKK